MKGPFRKTTVMSEQTVSTVRRHFEKRYTLFNFAGRRVFQQTIGIPMGTKKCAPLLADLL
jgi:hypothetical protein